MKILVTGAKGLLGQHIALELVAGGHEVITTDIRDEEEQPPIDFLLDKHEPSIVVHAAGANRSQADPQGCIEDNTGTATEVATAVRSRPDMRMALVSSAEVYGSSDGDSFQEDDGPFSLPLDLWAASKYWAEESCRVTLPPERLKVLRAHCVYGPGGSYPFTDNAMHHVLWGAARKEDVGVVPEIARSWMYVSDFKRAVRAVLENWNFPEVPTGPWQTYNIARWADDRSMLEIAEIAAALSGMSFGKIKTADNVYKVPKIYRPYSLRLRALADHGVPLAVPKISITRGMAMTMSYLAMSEERKND